MGLNVIYWKFIIWLLWKGRSTQMNKTGLPGTALHLLDDLMQRQDDVSYEQDSVMGMDSVTEWSLAFTIIVDVSMVLLNVFPITMLLCRPRDGGMEQLILALSITDVLAVLVPSPLAALIACISPHEWCHVYQLCVLCFQLAFMCLLSAMCVERWIAVRHLITSQSSTPPVCSIHWLILAIYAVSACVASLPLYGLAPPTGVMCHAWLTSTHARTPQQHVFCFLYLLLAYCNVLIVIMVNVSQIFNICQLQKISAKIVQEMEKRTMVELSVMVLVVTGLYHLTLIPALVGPSFKILKI